MAEYKAIRGHTIRTIAGDASPLVIGDIWYSSTTKKIRGAKLAAGAWASGGDMNTARFGYASGTGTQTAGMIAAGEPRPSTAVEQYDGSSWTEVTEMVSSRFRTAASGTQTATLIISGKLNGPGAISALVESWNGSAWTEVGDVSTARYALAASVGGTNTATITFGGADGSKTETESYNGTSWTELADLSAGRYGVGGAGNQTAALAIGGVTTANVTTVESWDGSAWTAGTAKNTGTGYPSSFGTQTAALATGGWPDGSTELAINESWDGSSWTEIADLSVARSVHGSSGAGSSTSGLVMGGYNGGSGRVTTEEWDVSVAASSFTSS
jgi:hypothetical protein